MIEIKINRSGEQETGLAVDKNEEEETVLVKKTKPLPHPLAEEEEEVTEVPSDTV